MSPFDISRRSALRMGAAIAIFGPSAVEARAGAPAAAVPDQPEIFYTFDVVVTDVRFIQARIEGEEAPDPADVYAGPRKGARGQGWVAVVPLGDGRASYCWAILELDQNHMSDIAESCEADPAAGTLSLFHTDHSNVESFELGPDGGAIELSWEHSAQDEDAQTTIRLEAANVAAGAPPALA